MATKNASEKFIGTVETLTWEGSVPPDQKAGDRTYRILYMYTIVEEDDVRHQARSFELVSGETREQVASKHFGKLREGYRHGDPQNPGSTPSIVFRPRDGMVITDRRISTDGGEFQSILKNGNPVIVIEGTNNNHLTVKLVQT